MPWWCINLATRLRPICRPSARSAACTRGLPYTESPMGRAMFTIIGAMAELESSLISERVTAGMRAAEARGKHLGRPPTPQHVVSEIVALATTTDLSIRQIQARIAGRASRSMVGEITKRARVTPPAPL